MPDPGFVSHLDATSKAELLARGAPKAYGKGDVIFSQGLPGKTLFAIDTGYVEVSTIPATGDKVVIGQLGPGDIVGEMALLDGGPRSASVTATTPTTGVLVGLSDVEGFFARNPNVMMSLLIDLSRKLRRANDLAEDRALKDGSARLAQCMLRLSERWGERGTDNSVLLKCKFSQGQLGELAGLTRPNVNRRLRAWGKEGILEQQGDHMLLKRVGALRKIAAGAEA